MRVLHIEKKPHWSGQEARTFKVCAGLSARGCEVSLLCSPASIIGNAAASIGLKVIQVPMSGMHFYGQIPFVMRLFRRERFDIVHAHGPRDHILAAAGLACSGRSILVRTKHNLTPIKGGLAARILYRNRTDGFIAVSQAAKETLVQNGVPAHMIHVVYGGVDLEQFSPRPKDAGLLEEFGLQPGELVIGVAGRLGSKSKDTLSLIRAAKIICDKRSDVRFLLAGGGAEKVIAEATALGLTDRVVFTGYRTDRPRIYSLMDIFVQPSVREAFANTILEAMAMGKPVVGTRIGGIPEAVVEGESGCLCEAGNPDSLANAVLDVIMSPGLLESMGMKARERAERHFSREKMAERTDHAYRELLRVRR